MWENESAISALFSRCLMTVVMVCSRLVRQRLSTLCTSLEGRTWHPLDLHPPITLMARPVSMVVLRRATLTCLCAVCTYVPVLS